MEFIYRTKYPAEPEKKAKLHGRGHGRGHLIKCMPFEISFWMQNSCYAADRTRLFCYSERTVS